MIRKPARLVMLGVGFAFAILAALAVATYVSFNRYTDVALSVDHTYLVILRLEELYSALANAETGQRNYVISGDEQYLTPYHSAAKALPEQMRLLKQMTADNPRQQTSMAVLEPLVSGRLAALSGDIDLKKAGGFDTAGALSRLAQSKNTMGQIGDVVADMKGEEDRLLQERSRAFARERISVILVLISGNLVASVCLLLAIRALTREAVEGRETERRLYEANTFLDSVFEHMPAMVFVKSAKNLTFLRHNKANQELLGYSEEQVIGKSDFDLFPKEQAEFFTAKDRLVLTGKVVVDIPEEPVQTRSQGVRILHTRKIPILDATGQALYLLGISEDITDSKLVERQIRELHENLELRAVQLEATNKELESFSYSISHDLRTPLRAIDGFSRMLQEDYGDKLDEEGQRLLQVIRDSSGRMARLIEDLLAFSRFGRSRINFADVDMDALAQEVLRELVSGVDQVPAGVRLGFLPPARGDRTLLRQVWANLLSNAVKYSSTREKASIEVTGHTDNADSVYCVKDNGVGFDMKYRDKLFGVFQRLHGSEEFPGTGVGLAIVQRIVTRHGGRVWADAKVNEGAAFYFSLPNGVENG